jgi:hypothetical protein
MNLKSRTVIVSAEKPLFTTMVEGLHYLSKYSDTASKEICMKNWNFIIADFIFLEIFLKNELNSSKSQFNTLRENMLKVFFMYFTPES